MHSRFSFQKMSFFHAEYPGLHSGQKQRHQSEHKSEQPLQSPKTLIHVYSKKTIN